MQRIFFALSIFATGLTALAAPTCNAPQVVVGNNCVLTVNMGWVTAGGGTQTLFNVWVPPNATGPVDIEVTNMKSSLGNSYSGYLGFMASEPGKPGSGVVTLADLIAGGADAIGQIQPGNGFQFLLTKVCWDSTCTAQPPSGAVSNMLSFQFTLSSPVTTDINPNGLQVVIQFLDSNGQVTFQEQEFPSRNNPQYSIIPGVNMGATPGRALCL